MISCGKCLDDILGRDIYFDQCCSQVLARMDKFNGVLVSVYHNYMLYWYRRDGYKLQYVTRYEVR